MKDLMCRVLGHDLEARPGRSVIGYGGRVRVRYYFRCARCGTSDFSQMVPTLAGRVRDWQWRWYNWRHPKHEDELPF